MPMKEVTPVVQLDPYMIIRGMVRVGLIKDEIAEALGIKTIELRGLIQKDPVLEQIFEVESQLPNLRVEQALYRRALGYQFKEVLKKEGRPVEIRIKELPPDVAACIFWLKNRDPDRWRDKIDVSLSLRDRMHAGHTAIQTGVVKKIKKENGNGKQDNKIS